MKVKDLIKVLEKHDPEMRVVIFGDRLAMEVSDYNSFDVWKGHFMEDRDDCKLVASYLIEQFVALNNIGDTDLYQGDYELVTDYEDLVDKTK